MYVDNVSVGQLVPSISATVAPGSTVTNNTDIAEYVCVGGRVDISRIGIVCVAAPGTSAAVVTVFRAPNGPAQTSGRVTIATLTLPLSAPVGTVYYKDINQVSIGAGECLVFRVTTNSTSTGSVICGFIAQDDPEYRLNESKMVVSA